MNKSKKGFWQTPNISWHAEDITLAESIADGAEDCWTTAHLQLLKTDDGVWHSTCSCRDPDKVWWEDEDFTFLTRRQAVDFHVERCRDIFRVRLKEVEAGDTWHPDEVLPLVRKILAQLDEMAARKQLDLFEA